MTNEQGRLAEDRARWRPARLTPCRRGNRPTARCRSGPWRSRFWSSWQCNLAEPALRPVPNARRPSTLTVTVVYAVFACGAIVALLVSASSWVDRPSANDARRGNDDDGGGGRDHNLEGPTRVARRARDHRCPSGCSRNCHHVPHELRLETIRTASVVRSDDRNVGEHRRPGSRPAHRRVLAEWTSLPLTLPYVLFIGLRALALVGWRPLRKPVRRTPREGVLAAAGIPGTAAVRRLRPSRRQGPLPACPGFSWRRPTTGPRTPSRERRCSSSSRQGWCPSSRRESCEHPACSHSG